jgi:hypothetical protein
MDITMERLKMDHWDRADSHVELLADVEPASGRIQ